MANLKTIFVYQVSTYFHFHSILSLFAVLINIVEATHLMYVNSIYR
jgi:hypothetical protein